MPSSTIHLALAVVLMTSDAPVPAGDPRPAETLTLEQAVARALELSPAIAGRTSAVAAAEARVTQAGLLPNPELALESENFGGRGALDGFDAAESTAVISQPVPLGGKRHRRRAVAEAERAIAERDLHAVRLDVEAAATVAFHRVLAAQQRRSLADELLGLAERVATTVQKRVDAGKVSPVEATRASVEVAHARVEVIRAARALEAARVLLAATWGSSAADFGRAVGELPEPAAPPPLDELRALLEQTPEVLRLGQSIERQRRVVDLERSFRIPDLTVSVGPRRFEETGDSAWVAGLSLPIPVFDRNQGERQAAELELEITRRDAKAARVDLEARLAATFEQLRAAASEATAISREIVPAAAAAFAAAEIGYREGKLSFLEVLDAQRSLFEARSLLLDSRETYATTRTDLERLVGRRLEAPADVTATGDGASPGEAR